MKRIALFAMVLCGLFIQLNAQSVPVKTPDLALGPSDLRIEESNDGGYLLYIRKKPDIESVVLAESTKDPENKLASYSLRSKELSAFNGIQQKILDGKFIDTKNLFFLMSSKAIDDETFGKAFRIFVPYVVVYGFPWSRYGEIQLQDGAYISIRAFSKPFADYSGSFFDNPYLLRLTQIRPQNSQAGYNKETIRTFTDYAAINHGTLRLSKGEADLVATVKATLDSIKDSNVDLTFCLDATESMINSASFLREQLVPLLQEFSKTHPASRFAIVQFRDYLEDFLYKITPFGTDFSLIQNALNQYTPAGGRDIPEAVNEALYASLTELDWSARTRIVVLIGDAPPHPIPRGSVTPDMVSAEARKKNISIDPIVVPD